MDGMPPAPVVLAYGVGVDSTALLIEKIARGEKIDLVLTADTGVEKPATYAYLDVIRPWMDARGIRHEIVSYIPKRFKHWPPYYGLLEMCLTNATLPSKSLGGSSCSLKYKKAPQDAFLATWQPAIDAWGRGQPPRTLPPERAYRREERGKAKAFAWESMGAWVRHMHRLFAIESPSSDHYARTRETARCLTVERIWECRHDDDLARCETMLVDARSGWLYGLDRAFSRAERGTLLVEVRNRRHLLALGRITRKAKGPRFDLASLPAEALDRLIQQHQDDRVVERLRAEREQRFSNGAT